MSKTLPYQSSTANRERVLDELIPCKSNSEILVKNASQKLIVGFSIFIENQSADKDLIIDSHKVLRPGESLEKNAEFPIIRVEYWSFQFVDAANPQTADGKRFVNGNKVLIETTIPIGFDLTKYS